MDNTINQRVKALIEHEGLNVNSFSKKIKLTQSVLDSMFKKMTEPSCKTIVCILNAYPLLSAEWLLRGKGEMFQTDISEHDELIKLRAEIEVLREVVGLRQKENERNAG